LFLFALKTDTFKEQKSKFYLQILSRKASFYIYDRLLADVNATQMKGIIGSVNNATETNLASTTQQPNNSCHMSRQRIQN